VLDVVCCTTHVFELALSGKSNVVNRMPLRKSTSKTPATSGDFFENNDIDKDELDDEEDDDDSTRNSMLLLTMTADGSNDSRPTTSRSTSPHHDDAAVAKAPLETGRDNHSNAEERKDKLIIRDFSLTVPPESQCGVNNEVYSSMIIQKLPTKLVAILADQTIQHIVSWLPHGRAWKIHNPHLFADQVLPTYFEASKYNSFVRLINAWGFRRVTRGIDKNAYYHELFLRGLPHLHGRMRRMTANDKKVPLATEDEPDFYKMSELHPLPPENIPLRTLNIDVLPPPTAINQPSLPPITIPFFLQRQQELLGYTAAGTNAHQQFSNWSGGMTVPVPASSSSSMRFPPLIDLGAGRYNRPGGLGRFQTNYSADAAAAGQAVHYNSRDQGGSLAPQQLIETMIARQNDTALSQFPLPFGNFNNNDNNSIERFPVADNLALLSYQQTRRRMNSQVVLSSIREQERQLDNIVSAVAFSSERRIPYVPRPSPPSVAAFNNLSGVAAAAASFATYSSIDPRALSSLQLVRESEARQNHEALRILQESARLGQNQQQQASLRQQAMYGTAMMMAQEELQQRLQQAANAARRGRDQTKPP